jgi:hypothetical protein
VKKRRLALYSLALTLAVWLVIAWPLPRLFNDAIPVGVSKRETPHPALVHMMAGDHLQFVYYLWIVSDFLTGKTPFFYNLYEFNTGDDAERYRPGSYYFPLSVVYSVFHWMNGRAFAWNTVSLLALWLAAYSVWRLGRRYTDSDLVAGTGALLALLFPYQWIQLFGGSPAGFGMAMTPLMILGLDRAVRDESRTGGWIAGLVLLCMGMIDTHAFYFGALMVPCWCLVAFTQRSSFAWARVGSYLRLLRALWPVPALAALAYLQTQIGTRHISQSHAAGGRRVSEVALFAPKAEGLWAWKELDPSYHIYFGYLITAVLAAGLLLTLVHALRRRERAAWQRFGLMGLVTLGVTGVILLAMGPFSPFEGRAFNAARKYLPSYTMIRQTAKIFVLLPSLLAVGVVMTLHTLRDLLPRRTWHAVLAALALGFSAEYFCQSKLLISLIDRTNAAYAAARADATDPARPPRAVIIPLWPGDSHYTSVYQFYASLYRIRMVNGYRPFVPREYIEGIFEPFRSLNLGVADDAQLDDLLHRGIDYILLHEDLFPEKVSPFPVASTLYGLLNHPRLRLLRQDGPTWAFRILPEAAERPPVARHWTYFFPARRFEAERLERHATSPREDAAASDGSYVQLSGEALIASNPLFAPGLPGLRWTFRVRGKGVLVCERLIEGLTLPAQELQVDVADWHWIEIPAGEFTGASGVSFRLRCRDGAVDVDMAKLVAGTWASPAPGNSITIPAPCFFHAGSIDLDRDVVSFVANRDRSDLIFYGPKLPLEPGSYRIEVDFRAASPEGTALGSWIMACPEGTEVGRFNLTVGSPAAGGVELTNNLPFLCAFVYGGKADLDLRSVTITRLR